MADANSAELFSGVCQECGRASFMIAAVRERDATTEKLSNEVKCLCANCRSLKPRGLFFVEKSKRPHYRFSNAIAECKKNSREPINMTPRRRRSPKGAGRNNT